MRISVEMSTPLANPVRLRCLLPVLLAAAIAAPAVSLATPPPPDPAARESFGDPAIHEVRGREVSVEDERILVRAMELLPNESAWNWNDDRQCEDDEAAGKRSLFCALQAASIEVLGTYDHRRVALQEVRFAIEEATRGRELEHRLMHYNNDPATELDDLLDVLRIALDRVRERLPSSPPSEAVPGA
jgi:hypothetical protein